MRWTKTHSEIPQLLGLSPLKNDDIMMPINTTAAAPQISSDEYQSLSLRDEMLLTDMQKNSSTRKSRIGKNSHTHTHTHSIIGTCYLNCQNAKVIFSTKH